MRLVCIQNHLQLCLTGQQNPLCPGKRIKIVFIMILQSFLKIIFVDPDLLIINKPAGLLSLPDGYDPTLPHVRSVLESEFGRLWIVHRLDKETSGIMLLARSSSAHQALNQQFQEREVDKVYHAMVQGCPDWNSILIETPLKVDGDRRHRTTISHTQGKSAGTQCDVLMRMENSTLLTAHPISGYTHQIRTHLASVGFPLLSDPLYGAFPPTEKDIFQRTALHAYQIQFHHPISDQFLKFIAPYPDDFLRYLNQNQPVD